MKTFLRIIELRLVACFGVGAHAEANLVAGEVAPFVFREDGVAKGVALELPQDMAKRVAGTAEPGFDELEAASWAAALVVVKKDGGYQRILKKYSCELPR